MNEQRSSKKGKTELRLKALTGEAVHKVRAPVNAAAPLHACLEGAVLFAAVRYSCPLCLRRCTQRAWLQIKEAVESFTKRLKGEGKQPQPQPGGGDKATLYFVDPQAEIVAEFDEDLSPEEIASAMAEQIVHYKRNNPGAALGPGLLLNAVTGGPSGNQHAVPPDVFRLNC